MEKIISNSTLVKNMNKDLSIIDIYPKYQKPSKVEAKIYEARLIGMSLEQMSKNDLIDALDAQILNISVICGHSLPENKVLLKSLKYELATYLVDFGYENLTPSELKLAFQLNCLCKLRYPTGSEVIPTEIFGSHISVDYIGKVLNTYCTLRTIFDNQLKNIINGY
jgi:hypothetical protein